MKLILESLGYQAVAYTNGQDALLAFQADPDSFDLVITDMTMPKMTGLELTKQLFSIRPDLPIILATGFSELINEDKAKALKIKKFLAKPVLRSEMAKAIREVLDHA